MPKSKKIKIKISLDEIDALEDVLLLDLSRDEEEKALLRRKAIRLYVRLSNKWANAQKYKFQ